MPSLTLEPGLAMDWHLVGESEGESSSERGWVRTGPSGCSKLLSARHWLHWKDTIVLQLWLGTAAGAGPSVGFPIFATPGLARGPRTVLQVY